MPICRFYQRGICRNGTACRFSHNSDSDSAVPKKTAVKDRIDSYRDAAVFVRRLNGHKNIDFCLSEVWRLKERLNTYIRDFDDFEINALFSLLAKCMEAFDKEQFDEVIRTLSASLVVATPDYVEDIRTMDQMLACMKVLVEVGRVDTKAAALIPADKFREQAKLIGSSEEPLLMPLQRIEFYKTGGAVRNLQARRGAAGVGPTDLTPDEEAECESLMHEFNLMPTLDEIKDNVRPTKLKSKLVINRAAGKWDANKASDMLLYRATHYYCLRQEFLIPLKEALSYSLGFATATGAPAKAMCYEHVKALPQPFGVTNTGDPYVQVAFTCQRPVDFTLGSHLIYGSLVALFRTTTGTPRGDADPESLVFATVVQFDVRETGGQKSEGGTVGIGFDETNFHKFQFDAEYCMLESPDYFLAKKPVFDFLRDEEVFREMPLLQKLLGDITPHDEAPDYLRGARIDLAPLYTGDGPTALESDPLGPWPTVAGRRIELDPAQQTAMRHILRRPIAVVQGPPGTGKSYLGVKFARLARAALDRRYHEEPMLAVTLTNHALDQFLEDLLLYMPGQIVRFGGRSKADNEALQECHVRAKMRENSEDYQRRQDFKDQLEATCRTLNSVAALYQGGDAQLVCILAYIPFTLFRRILAPVGWKMSFARLGHFAAEFAMESLRNWLEGTERQMAGSEKAWLKQRGFDIKGKVKTSNRFDPGRSSRAYESFCGLPDRQRKDLRDEMEAGVDRLIDHLFEFSAPTRRRNDIDMDDLDMDLLDLIEQERMIGDQLFADRAGRGAALGGIEIDGVIRGRGGNLAVARPSDDNVDDLEIDRPWKDEYTMAACFQQKIRGRLETTFGETVVAAGCHVAVHDAGTTCVNQAAPSRRSRQGLVEAVGTALEGPMKTKLRDIYKKGEDAAKAYMQHRKAVLFRACRGSKLIGMTSTYAALNQDLVHRLAPRVVIIEEAGELLECQLISSLSSPKLEHVVLIGDHQQLRPKINAFELCRKNHFDISLFERLINLNVPFAKLSTQLRMRPEVSQLVKHFYADGLIDHERVKKYDRVGGVATDVYFLDHRELEQSFEGTSKKNDYEARFVTSFALYLVRSQQYQPEDITLLTPYIGQKRLMRSYLDPEIRANKNKEIVGVRVATIDDYQGEENKVVILSLVRSNEAKKIGFVGIENRVIVALSRAKQGLYILGNSQMLGGSQSWKVVLERLREPGRIGPTLTLKCRNHPENLEHISDPADFYYVKDGGCREPCKLLLPQCGHRCPLNCHVFDHELVTCDKPCNRPRPTGCSHKCPNLCCNCTRPDSEPMDVCKTPCVATVSVILDCGHEKGVRCFMKDDPIERRCLRMVSVVLSCGHQLQVACYKSKSTSLECTFKQTVKAQCGHDVEQVCKNVKECMRQCERVLPCGHPCPKFCSPAHDHTKVQCKEDCEQELACGHKCDKLCGEPHTKLCDQECGMRCLHGNVCGKACCEICVPCREPCLWRCRHHKCDQVCHEPCKRPRCNAHCTLELACGHPCQGLCGEPCPICPRCYPDVECTISLDTIGSALEDGSRLYMLPDCGHTFFVEGLDTYMTYDASKGDHKAIQLRCCPTCKKTIFTAPRYNNIVKTQLALLAKVKEKLLQAFRQEVTLEERQAINEAMASDGWGAAAGHWFACPNGHPYFIADCGGAMMSATCPECHAVIGGANHSSAAGNTFIADFTGTQATPHWPGMGGASATSFHRSPFIGKPSGTSYKPPRAAKGKGGGKGVNRAASKGGKGRHRGGQPGGKGAFTERAIANTSQKLHSSSELICIFRHALEKNDPDLCLKVAYGLREKMRNLLGGLDPDGMHVLLNFIITAADAFEKIKYYELIRTLGATLVVVSADYINKIKTPQQLINYTKVMIEVCRWDPQSSGLVSSAPISTRAEAMKCLSDQMRMLLNQLDFHKEGGAARRLRARTKVAQAVDVDVDLCEDLMKPKNLLPELEEIIEGPSYSKKKPRMVNRVDTMWDAHNEQDLLLYRATHYHCLRQEFVIPLKEALCPAMGLPTAYESTSRTVCYEHVKATRHPFRISTSGEPYVQLKFSCSRPVDFTLGSHLIYGSLVALFQTTNGTPSGGADPETLVYATVEEFDIKKVGGDKSRGGLIGLSFSHTDLEKFSFDAEYCMLESPDYFLAKKPIFDFLRDASLIEGMPLLPSLLGSPSQQRSPNYLINRQVDLSPLYTTNGISSPITGNPLAEWPKVAGRSIELDPAQQEAMKPPGTGKSYLGVKFTRIARACLDKQFDDSPILAVTLTNHALDQFLEDLLPHVPGGIVRFGGRSKTDNPQLEECNVRNKKTREDRDEYISRKSLRSRLYRNGGMMNSVLALHDRDQTGTFLGLLAYIPADLFAEIVAPPECTVSFALLGKNAIDFAVRSLEVWLKGTTWQLPRLEQKWMKEWDIDLMDEQPQNWWNEDGIDDEGYMPQVAFETLPAKAKKKLIREMEGGVDRYIDRLLGFNLTFTREEEVDDFIENNAADLDLDIINQIELDRRMDDEVDLDAADFPTPFENIYETTSDTLTSEAGLAVALQKRICRRLEACLGAGFVKPRAKAEIYRAGKEAFLAPNADAKSRLRNLVSSVFEKGVKRNLKAMYLGVEEDAEAYGQKKKSLLLRACRGAKIVGMTSTFAALNRDLVHRLAPKVVIIEEAGELLECQLMACLSSSKLENVVLIGDHQQLRPKINAFELCRKNHFDISLFERLINLNVPFAKLSTQLRMRPEVSQLVKHFYADGLIDHERVKKYDRVGGVATDVYFLDHRELEQSFEGTSKRNEFEAKFAVGMATYLVRSQQYKPREITLLTPYIGQKRLMRNHLNPDLRSDKKRGVEGVQVVSIDDYQGEENKVIILSLVRSNASKRIGFVGIENRVIVALSRAREGLYILGNSEMFEKATSWKVVIQMLKDQGRLGPVLTLMCRNHPDNREPVSKAEDFTKVKDGGCRQPCDKLLPRCGHRCYLNCHVFGHDQVMCKQKCNRPVPDDCSHFRPKHDCSTCGGESPSPTDVCTLSYEPERKCLTMLPATLPCGHSQKTPCHMLANLNLVKCSTTVEVTRDCGHPYKTPCHQRDIVAPRHHCKEMVEILPTCGHKRLVACGLKTVEERQLCQTKVKVTLPCGHVRQCPCHRSALVQSQQCEKQVTATLPCGHEQTVKCFQSKTDLSVISCTYNKKVEASCGHQKLDCGHVCGKLCRNSHDHGTVVCKKDCRKKLLCGHICDNKCGSHGKLCSEDCRLKCSHGTVCRKRCDEVCEPCIKVCVWQCRHHQCNKPCNEPCDRPRCYVKCDLKLRCGHPCSGVCGEPCPVCPKCSPELKCRLSKKNIGQAVKSGSKLYLLPDCGHTFFLHSLDKYGKLIKEAVAQLNNVKTMIRKQSDSDVPKACLFSVDR
ncbi:hypothetical protein FOL47_008680 [Perkinsus chesapeaki]|uniref:NFX1-type zinc finger-containing protein 1 n=1 Tax=Perkinsus chesapeaki TaxID=330153 RepID=A0A7J6MT87_PERCH|nr:hypothetical protein FOL47_008680 [Perkinsus chesapeaki]